MKQAEARMQAAVDHLLDVFQGISTGRARSALLEHIRIEAYDQHFPLLHLALVSVTDHRTLRVSPHDRGTLGAIRRGILKANLGLNPQVVGGGLLVKVPQVDEDQRKVLCAKVKKLAEEQRVAVRNIRKDARNRAKRDDRLKRIQKPLEALTKVKIAEIDELLENKLGAINWVDPDWNW